MSPPFRPADGRPVVWRAGFGTRFTLLVDTEEEFDWRAPFRHDGWGVATTAALPDAHARLAGMGARSGYLVDYPVATDPAAIDALRAVMAQGDATIGAQLHPWVNPPFDEPLTPANSFAGNLPPALEAAKLDALTGAIAAAFGAPPLAFRSGRYGLGPHTRALLAARGYRLDSSVRARYDYRAAGGPDFSAISSDAYRCGPAGALIELPLTTIYTGALRTGGAALHARLAALPRGLGIAARLKLLSRVALTPEDMPLADALEAIRVAIGEGLRLLSFSFHSPSLAPGHTPYVRDAADLARFWAWWDAVLALLGRLGATPASLAELIATADAARLPPAEAGR